jgi:hypothetical protein
MQGSPNAERTHSAGLQTLLADGLCLEDDEPQAGPVIVSGIRVVAPKPCGRAFLLADNPDDLIQSLTRHCTVNGYTSWPALAIAFEAALREVHAEARVMVKRGAVL